MFNIARRHLLIGLAACPACASIARASGAPHWNYGDEGPEKWAELDPANRVCSSGEQQSPVDLHDGIRAWLPAIAPHWQAGAYKVANNGHTVQLDANPGGWTAIGDQHWELVQFHFHTPSEHTVSGQPSAMEVHFVHKLGDGLAVLGVLLAAGPANSAFSAIMSAAPAQVGEAAQPPTVDPNALLPHDLSAAWALRRVPHNAALLANGGLDRVRADRGDRPVGYRRVQALVSNECPPGAAVEPALSAERAGGITAGLRMPSVAPRAGLEPATSRLTADCSTN